MELLLILKMIVMMDQDNADYDSLYFYNIISPVTINPSSETGSVWSLGYLTGINSADDVQFLSASYKMTIIFKAQVINVNLCFKIMKEKVQLLPSGPGSAITLDGTYTSVNDIAWTVELSDRTDIFWDVIQ